MICVPSTKAQSSILGLFCLAVNLLILGVNHIDKWHNIIYNMGQLSSQVMGL